jgi:hypothetical protein
MGNPLPQGTMYVKRINTVARKRCRFTPRRPHREWNFCLVKVLVKMYDIYSTEGHNCKWMIPSCTKSRM